MWGYCTHPLSALKQSDVSSVMTAPPTRSAASLHFSAEISSGSPCSSGKSIFWLVSTNGSAPASPFGADLARKSLTSSSFFAFPVTKVISSLLPEDEGAAMERRERAMTAAVAASGGLSGD